MAWWIVERLRLRLNEGPEPYQETRISDMLFWLETVNNFLQPPHKTPPQKTTSNHPKHLRNHLKNVKIYWPIAIPHLLLHLLILLFPYTHGNYSYAVKHKQAKCSLWNSHTYINIWHTHTFSAESVFIVAMRSCQGQEPQSESWR